MHACINYIHNSLNYPFYFDHFTHNFLILQRIQLNELFINGNEITNTSIDTVTYLGSGAKHVEVY